METLDSTIVTTALPAIAHSLGESTLKLTASIQGDAVRVAGAKKDQLQECIALLRSQVSEVPIGFDNFRD